MATEITVDAEALHAQVQIKYREVALSPGKGFHFQTGRSLAERLGYPQDALDRLPPQCVESFAGVGNPFSLGPIHPGESVVDVGSGAGFDSLMAGELVGEGGSVTGVDMTPEMLRKARRNAGLMGASNVTFREGMAEKLPVDDASADVVISNGVVNLVPFKKGVLAEMLRVLVPGGRLYLSDIVVHKPVPDSAKSDIDLWTDWIGGALQDGEYVRLLEEVGFADVELVAKVDIFQGTQGEERARSFGTMGATIRARRP